MVKLVPKWVLWLVGAVLAVVLVSGYFRPGSIAGAGPESLAGKPAPNFDVVSMDGKAASLTRFHGEIVVLNLWASWCPPCRAEMPDLQRFYATYRSRGVVVVGIDQGESIERAGAFARSLRIGYPIFVDDRQQYGRVYAALGLPTTILINRAGIVERGFDGPLTYDQIRQAVEPLLPVR